MLKWASKSSSIDDADVAGNKVIFWNIENEDD